LGTFKAILFQVAETLSRRVVAHCFGNQRVNFNLENVWFMLKQISRRGQPNAIKKTNLTIIRRLQLTMYNFECFNRWLNLNWRSWRKKDVRSDSWNTLWSFTVKPWPRRFFVISLNYCPWCLHSMHGQMHYYKVNKQHNVSHISLNWINSKNASITAVYLNTNKGKDKSW